jgi:FlaA1/EpsC-like NDP-sugar epimerase
MSIALRPSNGARHEPDDAASEPRPGALRCVVVGIGDAGQTVARDLRRIPELGLWPVGFVDDGGRRPDISGIPVLGPVAELDRAVLAAGADVVVLAIPGLPGREIRLIAQAAARAGVGVRYLPSLGGALVRDTRVPDLRRVRVHELLGRAEARVVRPRSRAFIEGKRVLVTGAGGSIGSELCRQLRGLDPGALFLLDHDESNLHRLQLELTGKALLDSSDLLVADIRDADRLRQLFRDLLPDIVFHAAAHKHLPLLERHPCEGVKSNVLGTRNLVEAALDVGCERLILVSTDKAAEPVSVLGATKRLAEMVLQEHAGMRTRLASVRFGNVLGSRGSLLSILAAQIESGDDITVTHPDVTRYFMTVEEAAGLVIEAATMAQAAETFVLDMGEPVRILDLVRRYAMQCDLDPDELPIRFTGLRPGEKLVETLVGPGEERMTTSHPRIQEIRPAPLPERFPYHLERLMRAARGNRIGELRGCLRDLIPDYMPSEWPAPASVWPVHCPDDV